VLLPIRAPAMPWPGESDGALTVAGVAALVIRVIWEMAPGLPTRYYPSAQQTLRCQCPTISFDPGGAGAPYLVLLPRGVIYNSF